MADTTRYGPGPTPEPRANSPEYRLDSWKEIANYLGRSIRTVQQWERSEELPVHRLQHSRYGSVYALRSELEAWWGQRTALAELAASVPCCSVRWQFARPGGGAQWALHVGGVVAGREMDVFRPRSGRRPSFVATTFSARRA